MPAIHRFVAFDLGAESGRAVLGTLADGRLELAEKHRFPNPNGKMRGMLRWNLLQQWEELKTGLKQIGPGTQIHGIGVDTWGVDFGLIDADGDVLANPIRYRDGFTDRTMSQVFDAVGRQRLFDATGIQFMQFNTLFQLYALKQINPSLLEQARTLLFMPDLFHYLFCGHRRNEVSIASTSQMYDPRQKRWADDLLNELGVPRRLLCEIVPSGTVLGVLLPDVAEECGVSPAPVIAPASHDTASAVAAVPAQPSSNPRSTWCYISSGTWSLMGVELDEPVINDNSLKYNYTNELGVGGKVRFLKNIMGLWLVQECRRQWKSQGYDHTYAELAEMSGRAAGLQSLVDPDYEPFLAPGNMVGKIEDFCRKTGQKPPATRGDTVRACIDSLAMTYRRTLLGLQELIGKRINVIHIVGGGCQNELLNQMTADACGVPVVAGPIEATAAGNILVQAMATGAIASLAAAREVVRQSFDVKRYEPRDTTRWESAYERFMTLARK